MTTSQFTIYSSNDVGAPQLRGTSGSLVAIFDACLVDGYGSKSPAGWARPIVHESGSRWAVSGSVEGTYQNISGSGMTLYINDDRPNTTSTFKEAWATGWESLTTASAPVGIGSGQFPTPAQLLTTGHIVIRKSTTADTTARYWMMFADAYTFYFYAETGDGAWYPFWFGDIFSLKSSGPDLYRCVIKGRAIENSGAGAVMNTSSPADSFAVVVFPWAYSSQVTVSTLPGLQAHGTYMARTFGGGGSSIVCGMLWDTGKSYLVTYGGGYSSNQAGYYMNGILNTPNQPDNALFLEPFYVTEQSSGQIRGRFRGMYRLCHWAGAFSTGQILHGAGDYAGKEFMVIARMNDNQWHNWSVAHLVEISNTVETN